MHVNYKRTDGEKRKVSLLKFSETGKVCPTLDQLVWKVEHGHRARDVYMSKWVILHVIIVTKGEHSKLWNKCLLYFATFFLF